MINNRQTGRRGRGRNGARPQGGGGGPRTEQGNRIDNRSRGNANQLYEKYKTLARDSQTQGDRVMTEYYLQFADHYFRVLSETRARFEEQRRPRDENGNANFNDDYDDGDDGGFDADDRTRDRFDDQPRAQQNNNNRAPQQQNDDDDGDTRRRDYEPRSDQRPDAPREQREPRAPRPERAERAEPRDGNRDQAAPREQSGQREQGSQRFEPRERAPRRPRSEQVQPEAEAPAQIDAAVLPPAFALEPTPAPVEPAIEAVDGEEAPKRRRTRRPRREEPGNDVSGDVAA